MDKNLVVSLDEIKGIRLQCKKCGSEGMVDSLVKTRFEEVPAP